MSTANSIKDPALPSPSIIHGLPESAQTDILDTLFEPSPTLHRLSLPLLQVQSYPTYAALITAIGAKMFELAQGNLASVDDKGPGELDDILGAHPRLGEKKVDSALSRDEQARMRAAGTGSGSSTEEEEMLRRLNEEYEAVYPGLRYVVFVNGRSRSVIMDDMRMRIQRVDPKLEREQAIQAMCDIAADRAAKLLCEAPMDGQDIE